MYIKLLKATTKAIKMRFGKDFKVIIDNAVGAHEDKTFYVTISPLSSETVTKTMNKETIRINVHFFGNDQEQLYLILNGLNDCFFRHIKLKDGEIVNIKSKEPLIIRDEVGNFINFTMYIETFSIKSYFEYTPDDDTSIDDDTQDYDDYDENYEIMKEINIEKELNI